VAVRWLSIVVVALRTSRMHGHDLWSFKCASYVVFCGNLFTKFERHICQFIHQLQSILGLSFVKPVILTYALPCMSYKPRWDRRWRDCSAWWKKAGIVAQ